MKILFIYPNANSQLGFHYGIAHMSGVLKEKGHAVSLWQLCEEIAPLPDKKTFIERIQLENPDVIGFSIVTNQWPYTKTLSQWAREASKAVLVCGGVHALAVPEEILQSELFDYVFRGEAEWAFSEFIENLSQGQDVKNIKNLAYIEKGVMHINPLGPLPNLKKLPFKDYGIFDFQNIIHAKKGWVGLMASRGCPFSCTYCFNHQMVKEYTKDLGCSFKDLNYIRHFDIRQIIEEIQYLLKNYTDISMFIFDDDLFTYNKEYVKEFCEEYKKISAIPFVVNAHFRFFDKERAIALAQANCKIVKFGVESGSKRIRDEILNRYMSNEEIIEAIKVTNDIGLHSSIFLIIGFPYETKEDVMETISLMGKAKPGRYRWTYFYPYPNTKSYEITLKSGCLDEKKKDELTNFTETSCLTFGREHDLFLKKVGKLMPWFVNAHSDFPVASFYQKKVEEILAMDEKEWSEFEPKAREEDKIISNSFVKQGMSHYAIKYNPFMGVHSDYFTKEK